MNDFQDFIGSFSFDQRLAPYDIEGSIAHVKMLLKCAIISLADAGKIVKGLESIDTDLKNGKKIPVEEDIHYAIERELIRRIGPVGGKMHTARSRNDQVALDLRLYLREEIRVLRLILNDLIKVIVNKAEKNIKVVMPGYTHLQPAQPVLFSHHILAYAWMFLRDMDRLADCLKRVNVMPLGSAALAGTAFPIDRKYSAKLLGFERPCENSMDGVSDRDFAVEFISSASLINIHLSRLAEELVIWSSAEFDFVKIATEFTSGSSIMPQKRNPDAAEVIRAKTGRVVGDLVALLTIMKGLPLAYNRDMQEDKPPVFDAADTAKICLKTMLLMISSLEINSEKMLASTKLGFLQATELADYLAGKGLPFRDAHGTVKNVVAYCIDNNKALDELELGELKKFSRLFEKDLGSVLKPQDIVELKKSFGGTSRDSVRSQTAELKKRAKL